MARLRLVRDRYITGQDSCALRQHLDSVSPEISIWDIVDRCRVWESHADMEDQRGWYPSLRRSLLVHRIKDGGNAGDDLPGVADDITPAAQELLESLLQHLLPTPVVPPPKVAPIPSYMEELIHNLFPVGLSTMVPPPREPGRRDWSSVV